MGLDISVRQSGDVTLLQVTGRLTQGLEAEQLRQRIFQMFDEGHTWMLLDLSDIHVVDSAGVGELVSIHSAIAGRGGAIKFLHPSRKLKEMFHITRLERLFESYDDEQQALASFKTHTPPVARPL